MRLKKELTKLAKSKPLEISGITGAVIGGKQAIEVKGRDGFVYVRLRDNQSEFVQAYNDKVQNVRYDVPVMLRRSGNRYEITGTDTLRYGQWKKQDASDGGGSNSNQVMLLRHGNSHGFDESSTVGGGDIAWIYGRQFMPGLVSPYNSVSPNVYINSLTIRNKEGQWKYSGNTGTVSLLDYKPTDDGLRMVLVGIDTLTGNPELVVSSGTVISGDLTGTSSYLGYVPDFDIDFLPLSMVRLASGTSNITWDSITDVREFYGGGGRLQINGSGDYSNINFPDFLVITSGSAAFVEYAGGGGAGGDDSLLFSVEGVLATGTNVSNLYLFTKDTTIDRLSMFVEQLGTTGTVIADINLIRSGTVSSIFTNPANRLTLEYNDANGWTYATPDVTDFGEGDVLFLDIDSVSNVSSNLVITKMITGTTSGAGLTVEESGGTSVTDVTKIVLEDIGVTNSGGGIVIIKPKGLLLQWSNVIGTTDITTSSTSLVDMTEMSITMTTEDSTLDITFDATCGHGTDIGITYHAILIDGTQKIITSSRTDTATVGASTSLHWTEDVAAGSHTIKVQWRTNLGTARNYPDSLDQTRSLTVREFSR